MLHTLYSSDSINNGDLTPVRSWLEAVYSSEKGWKLFNRYNWTGKSHDFILLNDQHDGRHQRVIVSVNLDTTVSQQHYDNLKALARRMSQGAGTILKKILVFSDDDICLKAPADVELITISEMLKAKIRAAEPKLVA